MRLRAALAVVLLPLPMLAAALPGAPATAAAVPRLYFHSATGSYAADAAADPAATPGMRPPAGSTLDPTFPTRAEAATALYANGIVAGNPATPTFRLPTSVSGDFAGACVDVWLSKAGGTKPLQLDLLVSVKPPSGAAYTTEAITVSYVPGTVHRVTAYATNRKVPSFRVEPGSMVYLTTYLDADQGLTLHYDSPTYRSSLAFGADPASCPTPLPPPPAAVPLLGADRPTYQVSSPPAPYGRNGAEPSVGIDWSTDAVLVQSGTETFRVTDAAGDPGWEEIAPPLASQVTNDPILVTDRLTRRITVAQLTAGCSNLAISDDSGHHWTESPAGCGAGSLEDHQTIASGPYAQPAPPGAGVRWPHATYYCAQVIAEASCALSLDGGLSYGPAVPMYDITRCAGLHGHVKVGPDGTVYVPNNNCGRRNAVVASEDNGRTWQIRPYPLGETPVESDPSVAVGRGGTVYLGFTNSDAAGSKAYVSVSGDRGRTWSTTRDVGLDFGIQNVQFPALVAGDDDRAAFAFLGTTTPGDDQSPSFAGEWHLYVATTINAGRDWTTVRLTPNDPVQRGCINLNGLTGTGCRNLLDFIDAGVDREGRVFVAYADGCVGDCVTDPEAPSTAEVVHVAAQTGGARLFAAARPAQPDVPQPQAFSGNRRAYVEWDAPDPNGRAITEYRVYRGLAPGLTTSLVGVTTGTRHVDVDLLPGVEYFYSVSAVNSIGESEHFLESSAIPFTAEVTDAARSALETEHGQAIADGVSYVEVTARLRDADGDPLEGHDVEVLPVTGAGVTVDGNPTPTDRFGQATFRVRATEAGTVRLAAYDETSGVHVAQRLDVVFVPGVTDPASSTVAATPARVAANGVRAATVTVRLRDTNGNPVAGHAVALADDGAPGAAWTSEPAEARSDTTGTATFAVRADSPGPVTLHGLDLTNGVTTQTGATVAFLAAPDPVADATATAGNTTVTVGWTPAADGTEPTHHRVYRDGVLVGQVAAPATAYLDTGRTNGTAYGYRVTAYSAEFGESAPSPVASATPQPAPPVPAFDAVVPGEESATLSWTPGAGGTPVSGFRVYRDGVLVGTAEPDAASYTDTGLVNGQPYGYRVTAFSDRYGESADGGLRTVVPIGAPAQPTWLSASPGDAAVTVSWAAAASTPARPVSGYRVYVDGAAVGTTTGTGFRVAGLTNGVSYELAVAAYNAAAESDRPVVSAVPVAAPRVPVGLTVRPGNAQATLTWTAPGSGPADPVLGYRVYVDGALHQTVDTTSATVGSLTNNVSHAFQVAAYNGTGESPRASASATPLPPPNPPTGVTAVASDAQVALSWAHAAGTQPDGYRVYRDGVLVHDLWAAVTSVQDTGLANGVSYGYRVVAWTADFGDSTPTLPVTATPVARPAAPTGLGAVARNAAVDLAWTAAPASAAAPVSGYRVYVDGVLRATTAATAYSVTGLVNGRSYALTVAAYNGTGTSDPTPAVTATPLPAPNPPTGLTATPSDATVTLGWTAPTSGTAPTGYYVYRDNVYLTIVPSTSTSFVDVGRTNGVSHSYQVSTYSSNHGESARTAAVAATPIAAPAAPSGVTATAGSAAVTVSWTAATSTAAAPVSGYRVYVDGVLRTTVTGTSYSVTGLTNGTAYRFAVAAYNGTGESARPYADATPVAAPAAPGGLTATPGNASVALSWPAATSTTAAPVSGYRVYVDGVLRTTVTATSYSVTGLTNGTAYSFGVAAYNGTGESTRSTASATPVAAPAAPGTLTASPGDASVALSWPAATSTTAAPVLGYRVYVDGVLRTTVTGTSYSATGLTNGTAYAFGVAAYNGTGESTRSTASATPVAVPAAPGALTATPGNASVVLSWPAATSTTAAPVSGYRVYVDGALRTTVTGTSYSVTGLTNGTAYAFAVAAYNGTGNSAQSTASATPVAAPAAPGTLTASPGDATVALSWPAATSTTAAPVSGYRVYVDGVLRTTVTATSYTVTGLTNGTAYALAVAAYNGTGESTRSTASATPVAAPAAPGTLTASPGNATVALSWPAATSTAAAPVTGYRVYVDGVLRTTVTATSYSATGLTNGTAYAFAVAAYNGTGESTRPTASATPVAAPGVPTGLTATPGNGTVSLSWTAPASGPANPVTGYRVYVDGAYATTVAGTTHQATGLANGVAKTFEVSAYNGTGESARGAAASATPHTVPAAPGAPTVTRGDRSLDVSWSAVASPASAPVSGYRVYADGVLQGTTTATALTVTGLTNGTTYAVVVAAYNAQGESAGPATNGRPLVVPTVPASVVATAGDMRATVTWAASGEHPDGYHVYRDATLVATTADTSYTDTGLTNGTAYAYTVRAYNAAGTSAASAASTATPITTWESISAGMWAACGIASQDRTAKCWGSDGYGQLGDGGSNVSRSRPAPVVTAALTPLTDVSILEMFGGSACALRSTDGSIWCWGDGADGQIGDGGTSSRGVATQVKGVGGTGFLTGMTKLTVGYDHACAAASGAQTLYCWGDNAYGQSTASTSTVDRTTPYAVNLASYLGTATISEIATMSTNTCARSSDYYVYCWGIGLGVGRNSSALTYFGPGRVYAPDTTTASSLGNVIELDGGRGVFCARRSNGTTACWGDNAYGEGGNGSSSNKLVPTYVKSNSTTNFAGISQFSAGDMQTCSQNSGAVWCWGYGGNGSLGDGTTADRLYPVAVKGVGGTGTLTGIAEVSAGAALACARTAAGAAYCWGYNGYGGLGDGTTTDRLTPVRVVG